MANHKSALKRIRQNEKKKMRNKTTKAACRTAIKKTRAAVDAGELEQAAEYLRTTEKVVATAAAKGIFHRKNASRKISRLASLIQKAREEAAA